MQRFTYLQTEIFARLRFNNRSYFVLHIYYKIYIHLLFIKKTYKF